MNESTPAIIVLFGATGDLAQKKILPALQALYEHGDITPNSTIIAFSRRQWNDADYRAFARPYVETKQSQKTVEQFLERIIYIQGTFDEQGAYDRLKQKISELEQSSAVPAQVLYHVAIQPEFFMQVVEGLGKASLNQSLGGLMPRMIVEKPFGADTRSAMALHLQIEKYFSEEQLFRIDHYLGKEGLRAVLEQREKDPEFEKKLSADYVTSIAVTIHESIDIQGRGEFYERNGALRDVGQNHALEMLAVTLSQIPIEKTDRAFDRERAVVLKKLNSISDDTFSENVIRGQYEGYRNEEYVANDSNVETYFKITTTIDEPRWNHVQIILEAGKAMADKNNTIVITYKDGSEKILDIQKTFSERKHDPYELLIKEALRGDKTWFVSFDEVMASWEFVTPILEKFHLVPLQFYKKGSNL